MKRFTKVQLFFSGVCLLNFAFGCKNANHSNSTLDADTNVIPTSTFIVPITSEPDPLTRTRWKLVAFESEEIAPSIPEQPQFFVEFWKGQLSLHGGCNSVFGNYVLQNDHITITFAESTEVGCSHLGSSVNEIELLFSISMLSFDTYAFNEDELRISYVDGEILLQRVSD